VVVGAAAVVTVTLSVRRLPHALRSAAIAQRTTSRLNIAPQFGRVV